jgi:anti-anti-sigma factor
MLGIKIRQTGNVVILDLSGRIDVDSANLVEVIGQCVRDGYEDVLCNFEEVEQIDYMGISVVAIAYKEVINHEGRMKFTCIPAQLKNVLAVSGMDRAIEIYGSEDLALNSFKEDKIIENIKKMQLRRRFKRLPIDLKIDLKCNKDSGICYQKVDLINLSAVGGFIFGINKFKLGDEVLLKIKLAPKKEELQLEARVVWLPDKAIQPHEYPGIGVEFSNITTQNQQKLIEFIERNLSYMSSD